MTRTYAKLPPVGSNKEKQDEEKSKRPTAGKEAGPAEEAPLTLQRAVGNKAMRRLAQSVAVSGSGPLLPREPKYARYARWLLSHVEADGRQDLLRRFYALTMPQKRAALLNTLGRPALQSEQYTLDLELFERQVRAVKHVELRHGESEKEADERERGAEQRQVSFNPSGLLHPYREILLWLNYKAGKQGQAALMRRFGQLSAVQKQLAMHRMIRFRSLSVKAFTSQMTLSLLEREWVDWAAVHDGMRMADRLAPGGPVTGRSPDSEPRGGEERQSDDALEEIGTGGLPAALLSLLGLAGGGDDSSAIAGEQSADGRDSNERVEKAGSEQQQETESSTPQGIRGDEAGLAMLAGRNGEYWTRLLLGIKGSLAVTAIVERYRSGSPDKEAVVDRYLNLGPYPPARRKKQRTKRLKAAGFGSAADCYAFLVRGFAAFLSRGAKEGKNKAFRQALKLLAIPDGTDEQRATALIVKQLG